MKETEFMFTVTSLDFFATGEINFEYSSILGLPLEF